MVFYKNVPTGDQPILHIELLTIGIKFLVYYLLLTQTDYLIASYDIKMSKLVTQISLLGTM